MNINFKLPPQSGQGPVARLLALLGAALALALAFTFSLVFFALVAVGALLVWGYVWWKTRELRRQLRAAGIDGSHGIDGFAPPAGQRDATQATSSSGEIIEGEAVRVVDERQRINSD